MVDVFVDAPDPETIDWSVPVEVGGSSGDASPRRSPWPWLAGAAALGALAVLAVPALTGDGDATAPGTSTPTATSVAPPTTEAGATTDVGTSAPFVDGTPMTTRGPSPLPLDMTLGQALPFGVETGLVVYWQRPEIDGLRLYAYELDSGINHRVDVEPEFLASTGIPLGSSIVLAGFGVRQMTAGGFVDLVEAADQAPPSSPPFAAGPGATIWLRTADSIVLLDEARRPLETIALPASTQLYGSDADGRPIVLAPDERSWVITADGRRVPLSSGRTTWVDRGRYVELTCDEVQQCRTVAVGPAGAVPIDAVPSPGSSHEFAFADDGSSMTILTGDDRTSITRIDLATGTATPIDVGTDELACCSTDWGVGTTVLPLPHGQGYAVSSARGLRLVDASGTYVGVAPIAADGGAQVLAIGYATSWPEPGGFDPDIADAGVERQIGPLLPFTRFTGVQIHVATFESFGAGEVSTYDVDAGTINPLGDGLSARSNSQVVRNGGALLLTSDGIDRITADGASSAPAIVVVDRAAPRPAAPGPDGGTWIQLAPSRRLVLIDGDGRPVSDVALPDGLDLHGSTADGEPVVAADDGSEARILRRQRFVAYSPNPIGWVEEGNHATRRCDPSGCAIVARLGERIIDLGPLGVIGPGVGVGDVYVSNSSSDLVAVVDGGRLILVSGDGTVHRPAIDGVACCGEPLAAAAVRFLPDGLGVVAQLDSGWAIVGRDGALVTIVDVPMSTSGFTQVLGVTSAR
jgi:hypothetical protein